MMRREGTGGSLPVNQQRPLLPVYHVLFHLGNVVGDVVDDVHVQVVWRSAEHFGEGLEDRIKTD